MQSLNVTQLATLQGGTAVGVIGGIACGVSLLGPIGLALGGPTCVGMLIATAYGY